MANADPINAEALHLIMRNEGCVLDPYRDSVGVLTIGYGHTGPDINGAITQEQADALLASDLDRFEQGVDEAIGDADTTDNQFGAMVSLAYNVGIGENDPARGRHEGFLSSSVLRLHKAGDHAGAAEAFLRWDKAGGRVLAGLDRRRHEERLLYLKPDSEPQELPNDQPAAAAPTGRLDLIAWLRRELGI